LLARHVFGELGWEFYCPMEYGLRLWDSLWMPSAGGNGGGGYKAIDTMRLEKGYRYWSSEITPTIRLTRPVGFCRQVG